MGGAALVVGIELGDHLGDLDWRGSAAEPPAGHRKLFGECVEDHCALGHAGQRGDRGGRTRVAHLEVGLIRQHPQVVFDRDVGNCLHLFQATFAAERVLEVVVDDRLRAGRCELAELVEVNPEARGGLVVAVGHWPATEVFDLAFVDWIAGVRVEHPIAGVHQCLDELGDHRLAAWLHDDVVGRERHAAVAADVRGECFAERRDAGCRAIAGLAVSDRSIHCLHDVAGGGEVDVAEVERVDPIALGAPIGGCLGNGKGRFGTQLIESSRQRHFIVSCFCVCAPSEAVVC